MCRAFNSKKLAKKKNILVFIIWCYVILIFSDFNLNGKILSTIALMMQLQNHRNGKLTMGKETL